MMLRKTTGFALILTFISLRASIANAGILWSVSEVARAGSGFPGEFIFPETGLNEFLGWRSFQIDVRTDNGDVITAVDVRFRGAFHQRRVDTDFDGVPDAPTPVGSPANSRGDSHLTPAAGALVGSAPTEDSNGHPNFTSPLPGDAYGVGTFMAGAWGIPGANQTDRTPLAYVVLPA